MITLDEATIEQTLPLVAVGLKKYCRLQAALAATDVANDRAFQIAFNAFYRVRRNAVWQSAFFTLMQQEKVAPRSFDGVLRGLYAATGRIEASFASKLTASVDPSKPVIDSIVLHNLGLRLPRYGAAEARLVQIHELYERMRQEFGDYLGTDLGRYLVARFEECYPGWHLSEVKMLDLILWQTRSAAEPDTASAQEGN